MYNIRICDFCNFFQNLESMNCTLQITNCFDLHIPVRGRGSSAHALRGSSAHAPLPGLFCIRTSFFWWLGQGNLELGLGLGDYPLGFGGWDKGGVGLGATFNFLKPGTRELGFRWGLGSTF